MHVQLYMYYPGHQFVFPCIHVDHITNISIQSKYNFNDSLHKWIKIQSSFLDDSPILKVNIDRITFFLYESTQKHVKIHMVRKCNSPSERSFEQYIFFVTLKPVIFTASYLERARAGGCECMLSVIILSKNLKVNRALRTAAFSSLRSIWQRNMLYRVGGGRVA